MRKIILLLFLTSYSLEIIGQIDYIPIAKEGNLWIYKTNIDFIYDVYHGYYITGDSTFNNYTYKKIYTVEIEENDNEDLEYSVSEKPFALMRDDSLSRQSFCIFLDNSNYHFYYDSTFNCIQYDSLRAEVLLFDYSYENGDTLKECYTYFGEDFIIGREEVIYFETLTYKYTATFDGNYMGFGPKTDLFHDLFVAFIPESIPQLKFFCNGSLEDCTFNVGPNSITEIDEGTLQLYPNPVIDKLHFESNSTIERIEIYNLQGQMLLRQTTNLNIDFIEVATLKKGIYSVFSYYSNGKIAIDRFLKQ